MDSIENTDQQQAVAVEPIANGGGKTQFIATLLQKRAQRIRELAQIVRNDPTAREQIAEGFELIATAMEPCEDCGRDVDVQGDGGGI